MSGWWWWWCNCDADQIVVGSGGGLLAVFDPGADGTEEGGSREGNYRAEHLLIEQRLEQPIVCIECGRFVASSDRRQIAVLHPRKLIKLAVTARLVGHCC